MPTTDQTRRALALVTAAAVDTAAELVTTDPVATRDALLVASPEIVAYYSDGSAALAADSYDDLRADADPRRPYVAEPVVNLRDDKIRAGVLWSVQPLYGDADLELATERLAQVIQYETARPFRDTITTNSRRDPAAVGWTRVTSGVSCKFCSMLADRGAVYRQPSARFASHPHCDCTAAPVFDGQPGEEASVLQYVASKRTRTPRERRALRDHLAAMP